MEAVLGFILCFDYVLSIPRYPCGEEYHTCTFIGGNSFGIEERLDLASDGIVGCVDVFCAVFCAVR